MIAPLLLSKRKAARLLGVGRGNTLEQLIREGHIRTVIVAGRVRIPREEVERVAREGTEKAPAPRTAVLRKPKQTHAERYAAMLAAGEA